MKAIKIILIILLVITVVALIAGFFVIKNFDLDKYRTDITEAASKSLNKKVELGQIVSRISWTKGIYLKVDHVSLFEDLTSSRKMLDADDIELSVKMKPLVLERKIVVDHVAVIRPHITVFLEEQTNAGEENEVSSEQKGGMSVSKSSPAEAASIPDISVENIDIKEAQVSVYPASQDNPVHVIRNFFLNIPRFSLNEDISFKASGALVSSSDNFNVEGLVKINPNTEEVVLKNMTFKFNPETLSLSDIGLLTGSADSLKDIRGIKGDVQVDVQQCRVGADGLMELLVNGQWVRGQIDTINPMPVNQIDMRFTATEKTFELKSVDVQLESGMVKAQGRVEDYLKNPVVSFKAGAEDMDLAVLLKDQPMPAKVEGKLFISAEGSITDVKSAEVLNHLVIKGRLDVQEGEIKDVNLLGLVISKIPFVPSEILGVGERYLLSYLQKDLPEKYREDIQRQHTTIEKLTSQFVVKDGFLTLSETEMKTPQLSLTTDVVVDFNQNLTFKGDAFISPELSTAMIKSVEQFQALLDEQGQIHLPLKPYQGSLKGFKTYPNVQDFGKNVMKNELKNAIFDAIGVEKESPSEGGEPAPEGETQPKKPAKKPEEVLIENVLDAIFK